MTYLLSDYYSKDC